MTGYASRTWAKQTDQTPVLAPDVLSALYADDIPDRIIIGDYHVRSVRLNNARQLERRCAHCRLWWPANFNHFRYHPRGWNELHSVCQQCEREKARSVTLKRQLKPAALAYFGGCAYCGNPPGLFRFTLITMDHFIAATSPHCPGTIPTNLVPCCGSCNSSKHNADPREWVQRRFGPRKARQILARIDTYFTLLGK